MCVCVHVCICLCVCMYTCALLPIIGRDHLHSFFWFLSSTFLFSSVSFVLLPLLNRSLPPTHRAHSRSPVLFQMLMESLLHQPPCSEDKEEIAKSKLLMLWLWATSTRAKWPRALALTQMQARWNRLWRWVQLWSLCLNTYLWVYNRVYLVRSITSLNV